MRCRINLCFSTGLQITATCNLEKKDDISWLWQEAARDSDAEFIWSHILGNVHQVLLWTVSSFFVNFMEHFLFELLQAWICDNRQCHYMVSSFFSECISMFLMTGAGPTVLSYTGLPPTHSYVMGDVDFLGHLHNHKFYTLCYANHQIIKFCHKRHILTLLQTLIIITGQKDHVYRNVTGFQRK